MANLFSGLEAFGLGKITDQLDVYESEQQKANEEESVGKVQEFNEADVIFDKTEICPVCDNQFKAKAIKAGKVKLISSDTDLRPKYENVDTLKYDAIVYYHIHTFQI